MKNRFLLAGLVAGLAFASANDLAAQRSYVGGRSADEEGAPFSQAVWIDDTLYLSGMLGLAQGGVPDTAEEEARNVLNNMQRVLEGEGLTMDHLVSVQIFSSDVSDYQAFNGVYRTYFTKTFPARAFIGAGTLLFNARFEVQAVASRK
ncbi:MAG: RidA family protein [Gemmatimonadota bacterium]|nr:RidA family protein [Gemmatimonadota bacterium]